MARQRNDARASMTIAARALHITKRNTDGGFMPKRLSSGTVHKLPADLRKALLASQKASGAWEAISPLARNEWICWGESVKKQETKEKQTKRAVGARRAGKRRPRCLMGCIHPKRKPKNPSQKCILSTRSKRKS